MGQDFHHFGTSHWLALAFVFIAGILMVRLMRSDTQEIIKTRVRYVFGSLLIIAVAMDPVLNFMRYGFTETGWHCFWNSALPLYLCDIVSIIAAFALFTKNRYLTEIAYLWAIGGTMQGLLTPTLEFGWRTLEYYNFFLQHGGFPVAAVTLIWGLKIYPAKGAFRRAIYWSIGYMATVMSYNYFSGQNYGFLNGKPKVEGTLFDFMGPEPYYLITLNLVAYALYYILLKIAPSANE